MCGLFCYLGKKHIDLVAATDIIKHRGPDSNGFLQYRIDEDELIFSTPDIEETYKGSHLLFGFRRLAIIDLNERADQPFSSADQKYHVIFNGEIYNYKELKYELQSLGFNFQTSSDTEVLLQAYAAWGTACFEKFNGMWAIAILDIPNQKLICSRDRFGIKPMYYFIDNISKSFYFSSEIKQLFTVGVEKNINENVILDFLNKSILDHTQETFFKNIYSLKAGSYNEISLAENGEIKTTFYWKLQNNIEYQKLTYGQAVTEFKNLFFDSIRLRFRSDVPVGSCLSGGLDSSSIISTASKMFDFKINTFTATVSYSKYDEKLYAKMVSEKYKNISPTFCHLDHQFFLEEIDKLIHQHDEPFPSMGIVAQWLIMKKAKEQNVIVLLDGQGGDESLAGYRKFYAFYLKELLNDFHFCTFIKESFYLIKNKEFNFFNLLGLKRYLLKNDNKDYFSKEGKKLTSTLVFGLKSASTVQERSKLDIEKLSFPCLLKYEDRNSMAFSIETRIPFMDYRIVEFLYSLPTKYKIRNGYTKAILRDAMIDIIPDKIRKRISKLGFATPQNEWMNNELKSYFLQYFKTMRNPYLDHDHIYSTFQKNKNNNDFYFRIFCFEKWYQLHFG